MPLSNNLQSLVAQGSLCKAFGIRLVTNPAIVQLAKNAGFDALFIELEHSTLSLDDASQHCAAALRNDITPFVRVPYQCGFGFVQRVLDGGAMGVIFPHVSTTEEAKQAVRISKYPPIGCRSMTGQLPVFDLKPTPLSTVIHDTNSTGSSVILMIETKKSIANVDSIAAIDGVDVLLIGSNDLSIELGVPSQFECDQFRSAVEKVSAACRKHGKVLGLAGIYDAPKLQSWAVNDLGARFILAQQDSGLLASRGTQCAQEVASILA